MLDAQNNRRTISKGYKEIVNKSTHVINNSSSCRDVIFLTTKICSHIMEKVFPFLTNATAISYKARLIFT